MSNSFAIDISSELNLELTTVHLLCVDIDSPRALAVSLLLRNGEWQQYLDLTINPDDYEDPGAFARDYLVTEILSKSPNIPLGIERAEVALQKFKTSEAVCRDTNERLDLGSFPGWIFSFENELRKILGPLSKNDLCFIKDHFRFGPGATTGIRGVGTVKSDKYDEEIHLTADLIFCYRDILGERWWEHRRSGGIIVPGNRFTTVPKTAKTDRGICIEPTLNMYVQLGIGAHLRNRLKRFGINLDTQQEVNRDLAKRAFSTDLCTIDLSMASDTLALGVISKFFPERWVDLLDLARSPRCTLPSGSIIELEKISSMGNGFTFELETLVFLALCRTFVPRKELSDVSVFGDDIIIPRAYAPSLIEALKFLGFSVNTKKSFLAGNFFESCGADYFKGFNVRPFYLKGRSGSIPYALQIANKLRLWSKRMGGDSYCDKQFRTTWNRLKRRIPVTWKTCLVPESMGDAGLLVSRREAQCPIPRYEIEGYVVKHMVAKPVRRRKKTIGLLLSILARRGFLELPTKGFEPVRGYLGLPRPRKAIVSRWSSGLEWL